MTLRLFGIRHLGPGSARSLVTALDEFKPDVLVIEGPPEAEALLSWVGDEELRPPVALFAYADGEPSNSAFWPFAVFSPEWQALTWAARCQVPVRFMDLPAAAVLATQAAQRQAAAEAEESSSLAESTEGRRDDAAEVAAELSDDPFALLAELAGIPDPERWWDEVVESSAAGDRFAAVAQMMTELRAEADSDPAASERRRETLLREAQMRMVLRKVRKEHEKVAVVCGAWHVPALADPMPAAKADADLLRGLPKLKCVLAWVPWTHSRLAAASGYGAGVTSPGWYHHLFTTPAEPIARWLTKVANVLRAKDLPVSSAHVIEACRLADTLAALRDRSLPGLAEVTEAVRSVLCEGDNTLSGFVQRELIVGEELGTVPEGVPLVPLEADLRATAKSLRLAFTEVPRELDLDLRKDFDRRRSALLHRLNICGLPWG
ncbi:MAG: DUF5682 family protein, partial [Propionibacteriaceae bacterium]|nr:DUF5682 family protein [Propionibacteriaceae bacterium]